ncbi:MAG: phosphoglycerate kinase [Rhodothermales bacterium]
MAKLSIDDLNLSGQRVLVRVDFNVPLNDDRTVADDTRIRAALPTIKKIIADGGKAILMSHLGRPKGEAKPELSLQPVADYLSGLLGQPVHFPGATIGDEVEAAVTDLADGEVLLLENTRYFAGETKNDDALAAELGKLADVFVNDAFGTAHRAHASTEGITKHVDQAAMGYLVAKEVNYLSRLLGSPDALFVAVLGGAKVSDKIGIIENLLPTVDKLLIGGAMSYTFLKALGHTVGTSLVEDDKLDVAKALYESANGKILLPADHLAADAFSNDATTEVSEGSIPDGMMGLDIGPKSIEAYQAAIASAKTVVWNGPMGVFEMPMFAKGTLAIAQALADVTESGALTVVGGGDSVAAVTQMGYEDRVSHVSTGGGAMLEFLEGQTLPGIAAISDA